MMAIFILCLLRRFDVTDESRNKRIAERFLSDDMPCAVSYGSKSNEMILSDKFKIVEVGSVKEALEHK